MSGRTPTQDFRVNNFDLLRILAALQVVLIHSIAHLDIRHPRGWSIVDAFPGVPIFFVISGFLISASYERSAELRSYARNRLLRILPGLWTVIVVTTVVLIAFGYDVLGARGAVWFVMQLCGLIFTPGFLKSFGFGSYNGSLWTIPVELQFYVVLPAFYLATRRWPQRRNALLVGGFAVFTTVALVFVTKSPLLVESAAESNALKLFRYTFAPHIYLFILGVLLQRWQMHQHRWIVGKGAYWVAGYLVVHFALPEHNGSAYVLGTVVLGVAALSLAYTLPGIAHRVLHGNDISYGVYIFHGLVLNILVEKGHTGSLALLPLVVAVTVVLATLSWRLVEQPCLRRKTRSLKSRTVRPATA